MVEMSGIFGPGFVQTHGICHFLRTTQAENSRGPHSHGFKKTSNLDKLVGIKIFLDFSTECLPGLSKLTGYPILVKYSDICH